MITEYITAVYKDRKVECLKLGRLYLCSDTLTGHRLIFNMDNFKELLTKNGYTVKTQTLELKLASGFNELELRQYINGESYVYLFSGLAVKADQKELDFRCKENITLDEAAEIWKLEGEFKLVNRINIPDNERTKKFLKEEKELYNKLNTVLGLFVTDAERLAAVTSAYELHMQQEMEMSSEDFGHIAGMQ
ncbi:MAG: hypothetical protein ACLU8Q_11500 [Oscillospiraceae bacterium]|jgi:hypothetical protein